MMEDMFNQNLVDQTDIATIYYAKAKFLISKVKIMKHEEELTIL